jgi:hypothetical protein
MARAGGFFTNSQPSTYDRLSGTHTLAGIWMGLEVVRPATAQTNPV